MQEDILYHIIDLLEERYVSLHHPCCHILLNTRWVGSSELSLQVLNAILGIVRILSLEVSFRPTIIESSILALIFQALQKVFVPFTIPVLAQIELS